ncbi:MAG: PQQ-dependent sugar dehydrogenase [Miltoncostaeaceae bacterium]
MSTRRAIALSLAVLGGATAFAAVPASAAQENQGPTIRLSRVASVGDGLFVTAAPGQANRLYVVQQSGRVVIYDRGRKRAAPFLNVSGLISRGGERGLLGLAFHPQYKRNGRFFVNYTDRSGNTRVVEYRRRNANRANPRSARVLMRINQPASNHNGGHLAFGPDGFLYVGTGDGGGAGDPVRAGQNRASLLGKLLRIDVNGRTAQRGYRIPRSNPFRGSGAPEVYHYGLRNPWRFSFDRQRGDLWVGDVGQNAIEEVSFRRAGAKGGANFGWNAFEGTRRFGGTLRGGGHVRPVAQYTHAQGCSITGGYVYRGNRVRSLRGRYVVADFCSGRVWSMLAGPRPRGFTEITGRLNRSLGAVTSFGEGANGDLYVISNGTLYRFNG